MMRCKFDFFKKSHFWKWILFSQKESSPVRASSRARLGCGAGRVSERPFLSGS